MGTNVPEWLMTFFAAAKMGGVLVTVNTNYKVFELEYLLKQSDTKLLVMIGGTKNNDYVESVRQLCPDLANSKPGEIDSPKLPCLKTIVFAGEDCPQGMVPWKELYNIAQQVPYEQFKAVRDSLDCHEVVNMQYTSGTTGNPKGVMLTHRAILANVTGVLTVIWPEIDETWLSFLPLSHTFERTTTYYVALGLGNLVAFNRNIGLIQDDMRLIRPTVMMSVPRIYEKIYAKVQDRLTLKSPAVRFLMRWAVNVGYRKFCRANGLPSPFTVSELLDPIVFSFLDKFVAQTVRNIFGGRPHLFIAGGAALSPAVARFFLGLGIDIHQGYGMTETSPIISVNPCGKNHPATVGVALKNIQVRLGENDELQVKGPSVMKGYWKKPKETAAMFTEDGWLKTGDQADIYEDGDIRLKGRIKEIIVTSTGEKIAPVDLEFAIQEDPLFEQVFVCGENRPFISAVLVLQPDLWKALCAEMELSADDPQTLHDRSMLRYLVKRVRAAAKDFPSYGIPRSIAVADEPFTVENGLLTPTMKLRREKILSRWKDLIDGLYSGHPAA